jgi:hypothetical protein
LPAISGRLALSVVEGQLAINRRSGVSPLESRGWKPRLRDK